MKKNEILAITGMTGVGKDFLVARANQPYGVAVTNLGTLIGKKLEADRDLMMDTIDPDRIRAAQLSAYREVAEAQPHIVTCHAIRPQTKDYGYDLEMEQIFNPRCYVFVEAPAELIAQRISERNERGYRKSPEQSVEEIDYVQQAKLQAVEELVGILGCELLVITNTDEDVTQSTHFLRDRIGELL